MTALRSAIVALVWVSLPPLFYSAMSSSTKLAAGYLNIWQIGVGRFALGLVLMPLLVRTLGLELWGANRLLLALRGIFGTVAFLLLVAAFQRIPLSLAMVLFYLYPAFTVLLSPWVADEPSAARETWPFIAGAFAGTTLILWPDQTAAQLGLGHLFAVIASVLCAVTLLLVRRLGQKNNIYTLFFYLCLVGVAVSGIPLLAQEQPLLPASASAWGFLAAVAVFSVGAQLSINLALTRIPASKVSVMMTAEVPLVACFGVVWLGEPLGWRLVVGALLIFGSGIGLNLIQRKPAAVPSKSRPSDMEVKIRCPAKPKPAETVSFVKKTLSRSGMSKHLQACPQRREAVDRADRKPGRDQPLFHLQAQGTWDGNFWLQLEMNGSAALEHLDYYLRAIWLECCGHLSEFSAGGRRGEPIPMRSRADRLFASGVQLNHVYDFGTSSGDDDPSHRRAERQAPDPPPACVDGPQ